MWRIEGIQSVRETKVPQGKPKEGADYWNFWTRSWHIKDDARSGAASAVASSGAGPSSAGAVGSSAGSSAAAPALAAPQQPSPQQDMPSPATLPQALPPPFRPQQAESVEWWKEFAPKRDNKHQVVESITAAFKSSAPRNLFEHRPGDEWTLLQLAVYWSHSDAVSLILNEAEKQGCLERIVDQPNKEGMTALTIAFQERGTKCRTLVQQAANGISPRNAASDETAEVPAADADYNAAHLTASPLQEPQSSAAAPAAAAAGFHSPSQPPSSGPTSTDDPMEALDEEDEVEVEAESESEDEDDLLDDNNTEADDAAASEGQANAEGERGEETSGEEEAGAFQDNIIPTTAPQQPRRRH